MGQGALELTAETGDPSEELPNARADEENPSNTKVASRTREQGSCLKYKKRKCATQSKKSTARHSQSVRRRKITMWPRKRKGHQTSPSNSSSLEAPLEDLVEDPLRDREDEVVPPNVEGNSRESENEDQEQLMGALPSDQEDEEVPFKAKVAPGESQTGTPKGLLDESPSEREDEEVPSNSKVASGVSENALPEGLLEELLSAQAIEHTPFTYTKPVPRASNNDWLADCKYDSTSSEDEDDNPGHPITVTAMIHSEAFFSDSEESDVENGNMHLSTLVEEEESVYIDLLFRECTEGINDVKRDEEEEEEEEEMKFSVHEELAGVPAPVCEYGGGDRNLRGKMSTDPTTDCYKDAELEASA
ncbi:uncharacterized protein [Dasypus novemcinctus]|uniref:uncharacterized protein isoform X1 n=2 Tax=Dasypus novemcinctus TaxID=9361 RepID=UPI00265E9FD9|nr:uncharacterized protein LOC131274064 isoform X1 [Dasypus novemcinctus]